MLVWFGASRAQGIRSVLSELNKVISRQHYARRGDVCSGDDRGLLYESQAQAQEYKLGAGDKVRVVVLADPEFSGEYEVDASGNISVRMIGRMSVLGMTTAQLEAELDRALQVGRLFARSEGDGRIVKRAAVFHSGGDRQTWLVSYVAGFTVAQAVAIAGGYTRRASTSRIKIKRFGSPAGTRCRY